MAVVCSRTAVTNLVFDFLAGRERHVQRMRWEHQLLLEAEHVVCNHAVVLVERTKCLNLLDFGNHAITKCNERLLVFVGVL